MIKIGVIIVVLVVAYFIIKFIFMMNVSDARKEQMNILKRNLSLLDTYDSMENNFPKIAIIFVILISIGMFIIFKSKIGEKTENFETENIKTKLFDVVTNDSEMENLYKKMELSKLLNNNELDKFNLVNKIFKIAFVTYEDRKSKYIDIHDENLTKYCKKWGYDYVRRYTNPTKYSPYWYKIVLVKETLNSHKNYDYVVWMDSDSVIMNGKTDISTILSRYDSDIFIGSDNIKVDIGNAGVFYIRNTSVGRNFIDDLINSYNDDICMKPDGKLNGKWAMSCYEQGQMNKLIHEKYSQNTTFLGNDIIFSNTKCKRDTFMMHLYGKKTDRNISCLETNDVSEINKETKEIR